MCAKIVEQILNIEVEADRIIAEAEAEAKRIHAEAEDKIASLRKTAAAESESASARQQAEFEQSWKNEEDALRSEFSAARDHIQKTGAARLSSAIAWVVKKVTDSR
ncbi:MAG: hypothetical protein AB1696_05645 [Planctomycetota bacterium]